MVTKDIDFLDLGQIAGSGQCFRWKKLDENKYRIPACGSCLDVAQTGNHFEFSCTKEEFESIWYNYFDLGTDYGSLIKRIDDNDKFLKNAAEYGRGIRILNQDIWETIISFIISQNNNIPRIKKSIEAVCRKYNRQTEALKGTDIYMMPYLADIEKNGGRESLSGLGLGYRDGYIWGMCSYQYNSPGFIDELEKLDYESSMKYLMGFKGIGKKVANCICLYGLHHLDACPVDVWMKKIIDEEYNGVMPAWMADAYAGVYQQYAFFYKRAVK